MSARTSGVYFTGRPGRFFGCVPFAVFPLFARVEPPSSSLPNKKGRNHSHQISGTSSFGLRHFGQLALLSACRHASLNSTYSCFIRNVNTYSFLCHFRPLDLYNVTTVINEYDSAEHQPGLDFIKFVMNLFFHPAPLNKPRGALGTTPADTTDVHPGSFSAHTPVPVIALAHFPERIDAFPCYPNRTTDAI